MEPKTLTMQDLEAALSDDVLMEKLADYMETEFSVTAPRDLKSSVLLRSRQTQIPPAGKTESLSRHVRLLFYSLKVGTATAACIFLLSLLPTSFSASPAGEIPAVTGLSFSKPLHEKFRKFTGSLHLISDELWNWEDQRYDK